MSVAPIALFVYSRPEHTRLTIEALQKNEFSDKSSLYVFSDAAKTNTADFAVASVRAYLKTITGFKKITIIERENNWGLANSIIDGVTVLCEQYGKVIVLEDDLETSPFFLTYMNNALEKYKSESKVMQISGHMFDVEVPCQEDALFLPFTTSWGWATWGDRWTKFDANATNYTALKLDKNAIKRFNLDDSYPYFKMLESQMQGKIDSWAIRWNLTVFMQNGLVLFPKRSMVKNNGFDGSGVHCGVKEIHKKSLTYFEIKIFPNSVSVVEQYKNVVFNYLKISNSVDNKLVLFSAFKQMINKLRS